MSEDKQTYRVAVWLPDWRLATPDDTYQTDHEPRTLFRAPIAIEPNDTIMYDFGSMELISITRGDRLIWHRDTAE